MTAAAIGLRGASTHTLDDKARLIVPKRILERLPKIDSSFVLTASQDKCLLLLPRAAFDSKVSDLEVDPLGEDSHQRAKLRRFLGHAEDVNPDRSGRILISEALRTYMGLRKNERDVVVVGMGGMVELWSAKHWARSVDTLSDDMASPRSLSDEASSVESDDTA